MPYLYLLLIVSIPFDFILIRFIVKRLRLAIQINKLCTVYGYRLYISSLCWMLGLNNTGKSDFTVETDRHIYSVRMIPTFLKRRIYTFHSTTRYTLSDIFPFPRLSYRRNLADKKLHDVNYTSLTAAEGKDIVPVMLFNPAPMNVSYLDGTTERQAGDGDKIFGITIFGASGFVKHLKGQCIKQNNSIIKTSAVHMS